MTSASYSATFVYYETRGILSDIDNTLRADLEIYFRCACSEEKSLTLDQNMTSVLHSATTYSCISSDRCFDEREIVSIFLSGWLSSYRTLSMDIRVHHELSHHGSLHSTHRWEERRRDRMWRWSSGRCLVALTSGGERTVRGVSRWVVTGNDSVSPWWSAAAWRRWRRAAVEAAA